MTLKRTPLHEVHEALGAKRMAFGGWDMPVQFASILQEHESVRTRVGLFDVSHMGEFKVSGPDATRFLQAMVTNDVERLIPGKAMYTLMVYPHGGTVDDVLLYRTAKDIFWMVVNAGNIEKDWSWLTRHQGPFDVQLANQSPQIALLALQGPMAEATLQPICSTHLSDLGFYSFTVATVAGIEAVVSRTGYTGEDGFELYVEAATAVGLWHSLLKAGQMHGIVPCGLGARDTLRLEAGLPLYEHELTEDIAPLEAGLGRFVRLQKGDFIGRDALVAMTDAPIGRTLVGVLLTERGIPRAGQRVFHEGVDVGFVSSGTLSPTLKQGIGMAIVDSRVMGIGTELTIDIRGRMTRAEVVKLPFYKRNKKG